MLSPPNNYIITRINTYVNRFYKKQWGLGILYFLTCGVFFIGWIYDTVI
ncbi:NINE protein [Caldicellulosiruptoraceae bacterium PP1]